MPNERGAAPRAITAPLTSAAIPSAFSPTRQTCEAMVRKRLRRLLREERLGAIRPPRHHRRVRFVRLLLSATRTRPEVEQLCTRSGPTRHARDLYDRNGADIVRPGDRILFLTAMAIWKVSGEQDPCIPELILDFGTHDWLCGLLGMLRVEPEAVRAALGADRELRAAYGGCPWFRGTSIVPAGTRAEIRLQVNPAFGFAREQVPETLHGVPVDVVFSTGAKIPRATR